MRNLTEGEQPVTGLLSTTLFLLNASRVCIQSVMITSLCLPYSLQSGEEEEVLLFLQGDFLKRISLPN